MRFWMTGMFASALTGFVWVGLWHLVLTMMAILATGAALPLGLGPAAFSGLVAGVFAALQRPASLRMRSITGIILIACLLFIFSLGAPFDPQQHEAMAMVPNADAEPNSVMEVMQRGYTLNGRLVRAAKVIVTKAP